jgi:hypothetical protein
MNEFNNKKVITKARNRLQFEVFKGIVDSDGLFKKIRLAGLGFLREGKHEYQLKLFAKVSEKFILRPIDPQLGTYQVLARDEIKINDRAARVYLCEVGDAQVIAALGLMEIKIDLCSEPVYMSIFPKIFERSMRVLPPPTELRAVV